MNFFKPEDFDFKKYFNWKYEDIEIDLAKACNQKLEREGKVMYGQNTVNDCCVKWHDHSQSMSHKALLINIEPIEKCKHDKNPPGFLKRAGRKLKLLWWRIKN